MEAALGPLPESMIEQASSKKKQQLFVEQNGQYVLRKSAGQKPKAKLLEETLGVGKGGPSGRRKGQPGHSTQDYKTLVDLLNRILTYDPEKVCIFYFIIYK